MRWGFNAQSRRKDRMMKRQQPMIDGKEIDQEIAERIPCEKCGGKCRYESEVTERSYRAFAVCTNPECQYRAEF